MVRRLSDILPPKTLRAVAMGMWQSRLMFALALVGGLWFPSKYIYEWNHTTTAKGGMELLQRSQNQFMRILTGIRDLDTPTTTLLRLADMLSVNQLCFMLTVCQANKALVTGKPEWLAMKLHLMPKTRTNDGGLQNI